MWETIESLPKRRRSKTEQAISLHRPGRQPLRISILLANDHLHVADQAGHFFKRIQSAGDGVDRSM